MTELAMEPILEENKNRFVLTVEHEDIDEFYQKHKAAFWTAQEIDLQQDLSHWGSDSCLGTAANNFFIGYLSCHICLP